jgi:GT2 family glycosyltransferase
MQLSVVIVNYNVEYFLEQCLRSVFTALKNVEGEVWVVDNNSVDGSVAMVKDKFPQAKLIENKQNTGFSFANNQAMRLSSGKYILLLNPDTLVEEDTFEKVLAFMDAHPDAGGLGVKMIDGRGVFLPESKRGLPTPAVAFYKIFGLSALFPKSKKFGRYHLGFLDKDKTHEVDVLSGAFMLMRKETLDKVGLLDEEFFMYGEDIDLSYRIQKGGYKNYYFPDTRIIHYKGESTKKGSVNYVFVFYRAMVIFARKHFSQQNAATFSFLINMAIYLRAGLAIVRRFAINAALPLFDAAVLFGGMYFLKEYWEHNQIYVQGGTYPALFMQAVVPSYILFWLGAVYYSGGYDKPLHISRIVRGIIAGTLLILVGYALLNEEYRFSRALILLGAVWAVFTMVLSRLVLHAIKYKTFDFDLSRRKRIAIVALPEEGNRVLALTRQSGIQSQFIKLVSPTDTMPQSEDYIGTINQLADITRIYGINEVIFCAKDISAQEIISHMSGVRNEVEYKIAPPESLFIIGSNSINTNGDLYVIDINSIAKAGNRRSKRLFDVFASVGILALLPIILFTKGRKLLPHIPAVLFGQKTWVGYNTTVAIADLPKLKPSPLNPADSYKGITLDENTLRNLNTLYAKDYRWVNDLNVVVKSVFSSR